MSQNRVHHLSVSRRFSTSRFEQVNFSIAIDPSPDAAPGALLREMEEIMDDLNPCPPVSPQKLEEARRIVAMSVEERASRRFHAAVVEEAIENHRLWLEWKERRGRAFARLDALGAKAAEVD